MAPAAYVAQAGMDAARAMACGRPPAGQLADVVAAMDAAVIEARREGSLLNQAIRTLDITRQRPPELGRYASGVDRAARRMEAVVLRVARELLR